MQKYIFMMILICSSSFANEKNIQGVDEIEQMVVAFLEPHNRHAVPHRQERNLYIQMGAFSHQKPTSLLKKLKQRGYHVSLKPTFRNKQKLNLVLVGPYKSKDDVEKHLVRLRITVPGAFIYHEK